MVGGTGHSKQNCSDRRAGEGMGRRQILTELMPSVPEADTEDRGGRSICLRTWYRNPRLYNQKGRWAGAGLDPLDLASKPVGGLRTTQNTSS